MGLRVWDNEGEASNVAEGTIRIVTSGNSNDMYVWGINPRIKPTGSGSTPSLIVTARNDSDENGQNHF